MTPNKLNFKRTLRKYEFLIEELEDVKSIYNDFTTHFNEALIKAGYQPEKPKIVTGDTQTSQNTESLLSPKYKKLFRQIVLKTHPDKLSNDVSEEDRNHFISLYEQAVSANENGDITPILFVAIKLELDVSNYMKDVESIVKSCEKLEEEINKLQKSSCWYWNELTDEKEKEKFVEKFISFIKK